MAGGLAVLERDTDALIKGTQKGPTGTTIIDRGKDFKSCGAIVGLAVQNVTAGTFGHIVSVTSEDEIICDISFANGASCEIYHTATYNSVISKIYTDRRFGHKVTNPNELIDGIFPEDRDVDEDGRKAFGPGEPWETKL